MLDVLFPAALALAGLAMIVRRKDISVWLRTRATWVSRVYVLRLVARAVSSEAWVALAGFTYFAVGLAAGFSRLLLD